MINSSSRVIRTRQPNWVEPKPPLAKRRGWFMELLTLLKKYQQANQEYRQAIRDLNAKTGIRQEALRRAVAREAKWGYR